MTAAHLDRIARAQAEIEAHGLDALVLSPSPDLRYLTGYDPIPFERPTLLVLRPGADPVLLVPELERPLAAASPTGDRMELVAWRDGSIRRGRRGILGGSARVAVADRLWASHLLGLQRALPGASFTAGSPLMGDSGP